MQTQQSKKSIIIFIIVLLLAGGAYFFFKGSPANSELTLEESTKLSAAAAEGAKVLNLLNQINLLKIDPAIFSSEVYRSLVDHTVVVIEQNVGKTNPFTPFASEAPAPTRR